MNDKRQITAVFGCTMEGEFLPPQIIYGGKTACCLPLAKFPDSWDITYSPNHWANEKTQKATFNIYIGPIYRTEVLFLKS